MVTLSTAEGSDILTAKMSGMLSKQDYRDFVPTVEDLINTHGKIRIIIQMQNFHGWDAGALWEDIKFDARHFNDIERLALVGEKKWEKGMAVFCKPFTTAEVRYFESDRLEEAREWITS
jgi:hypothetical protein